MMLPDLSTSMLLLIAACAAILIWSWHRSGDSQFDLRQALVDNVSGRMSIEKVGYSAAIIIGSWGFVSLLHQGKMTEGYFMGYLSVFVVGRAVSSGITVYKDVNQKPPPGP